MSFDSNSLDSEMNLERWLMVTFKSTLREITLFRMNSRCAGKDGIVEKTGSVN